MPQQFFTSIDMNSNAITEVATPSAAADAATKAYVDGLAPEGFSATFGDGTATAFAITHNLGTVDILYKIQEVSSGDFVDMGVSTNGINAIDITATPAPAANAFRITILPRP